MTIRGICGKTFSQAKSVRICEICGKTSLKLRAEESPTDYADLHGYWVRRSLPQITQIYTDIGYGEKDTNHTDVAQEISVAIRDICGKHSLKQNP